MTWRQKCIWKEWRKANGTNIPKELNSTVMIQLRQISLLNVKGKLSFSAMARGITTYLTANKYSDPVVQKGRVPGISECLAHPTMIWEATEKDETEKRNKQLGWLELANAYGAVPPQLL